jgi:hypothetical protein
LRLSGEKAVCVECVKNCKLSEALTPSSCNLAFNANRAPKDSRSEQFGLFTTSSGFPVNKNEKFNHREHKAHEEKRQPFTFYLQPYFLGGSPFT